MFSSNLSSCIVDPNHSLISLLLSSSLLAGLLLPASDIMGVLEEFMSVSAEEEEEEEEG